MMISGVMGVDQIPMAIQSGMRAIAVQFDVWGTTRLFANSLEEGWRSSIFLCCEVTDECS